MGPRSPADSLGPPPPRDHWGPLWTRVPGGSRASGPAGPLGPQGNWGPLRHGVPGCPRAPGSADLFRPQGPLGPLCDPGSHGGPRGALTGSSLSGALGTRAIWAPRDRGARRLGVPEPPGTPGPIGIWFPWASRDPGAQMPWVSCSHGAWAPGGAQAFPGAQGAWAPGLPGAQSLPRSCLALGFHFFQKRTRNILILF